MNRWGVLNSDGGERLPTETPLDAHPQGHASSVILYTVQGHFL